MARINFCSCYALVRYTSENIYSFRAINRRLDCSPKVDTSDLSDLVLLFYSFDFSILGEIIAPVESSLMTWVHSPWSIYRPRLRWTDREAAIYHGDTCELGFPWEFSSIRYIDRSMDHRYIRCSIWNPRRVFLTNSSLLPLTIPAWTTMSHVCS